jgi:hypothetical protein
MAVSSKMTGWRFDPTNDRLNMYYKGTIIAYIDATTLTMVGTLTPAVVTGTSLLASGAGGVGYKAGAGGTVTQGSSATTGVTLSKPSGQITTYAENIAAAAEVQFTVTNTTVAAVDTVSVSIASGSTGGTTIASVTAVADGSFQITLTNLHASTAETGTLVINFNVIKGIAT